jgi:hypothetical protein
MNAEAFMFGKSRCPSTGMLHSVEYPKPQHRLYSIEYLDPVESIPGHLEPGFELDGG